jgi:cytochrome b
VSSEAGRAGLGESRPAGSVLAGRVKAWDLPTRLFKWSLVLLVLNAWLTNQRGDAGITWHIWNGYAVLVLLVFRLLWGVFGSSTARFATWVTWPWTALRYGLDLLRGRGRPYLSHNPLGGWMIIILLLAVGSQALAGLFTVDNNGLYGGPFANLDFGDPTPLQRALSRYHHLAFNILLALVALHVGVNLFYQFVKKDPVIGAMITGKKPVEPFADQAEMQPGRALWLRALLCLVAALAIVLGGVKLAGGSLP